MPPYIKRNPENEETESGFIKIEKNGFYKIANSNIIKWIVTTLIGATMTVGAYYIKTEYVPRKEIEEKYILKKDFDSRVESIENAQKDFVNKEVYNTKMEAIKDSLSRIERALDENNRVLREVIEKASR